MSIARLTMSEHHCSLLLALRLELDNQALDFNLIGKYLTFHVIYFIFCAHKNYCISHT